MMIARSGPVYRYPLLAPPLACQLTFWTLICLPPRTSCLYHFQVPLASVYRWVSSILGYDRALLSNLALVLFIRSADDQPHTWFCASQGKSRCAFGVLGFAQGSVRACAPQCALGVVHACYCHVDTFRTVGECVCARARAVGRRWVGGLMRARARACAGVCARARCCFGWWWWWVLRSARSMPVKVGVLSDLRLLRLA